MYMVDERFLTFLGSHNDALKSDENFWFLPGAGGGGSTYIVPTKSHNFRGSVSLDLRLRTPIWIDQRSRCLENAETKYG